MKFGIFDEYSYLIDDIKYNYRHYRFFGNSREQAINMIKEAFCEELCDTDESPYVQIALALVLSKKNELTLEVKNDALEAIAELRVQEDYVNDKRFQRGCDELKEYLSDERIGPEAEFRAVKRYKPEWKIGDTFIHAITSPEAEQKGFSGCYIVLCKVGEYLSIDQKHMQIVYSAICSKEAIPTTEEELNALGWVRMLCEGNKNRWSYIGQLDLKSKKDEERWNLQKIGCFPNIKRPSDEVAIRPLVSMPITGFFHKEEEYPHFENNICRLAKENGIKKPE